MELICVNCRTIHDLDDELDKDVDQQDWFACVEPKCGECFRPLEPVAA